MLTNSADPHVFGPAEPGIHFRHSLVSSIDHDVSLLHMAYGVGHQKIVKNLLACGVKIKSSADNSGISLCAAAAGGHLLILQILLDAGVNTNEDINCNALWFASCHHHSRNFEELIFSGATLGIRHDSRNVLKTVVSQWQKDISITMLLLDSLEDTAEEVAACEDALVSVCNEGDDGILKLLLENGALPFLGLLY